MGSQRKGNTKIPMRSFRFWVLMASGWLYALNSVPSFAAEAPILSVVQSQENATQWTGITSRLQAAGVRYCVIPLAGVRSTSDWGDSGLLFLPNVETLTPQQAIALEEWVNQGGRVIASGPVGSLSAPGVRQLLRTLLGGYWGFSLNSSATLKPSKQQWSQSGLSGTVRGGVIVANDATSQPGAVWESKDNPIAVVTTERSTLFGWRWGVDAASNPELDSAWLQAAVKRYSRGNSANGNTKAQNCPSAIATAPKTISIPPTRISPVETPIQSPQPTPRKIEEPIDRLEQRTRLNVVPSTTPINNLEAIALKEDLENLVGRVESARLAANTIGNSSRNQGESEPANQALAQARGVVNSLPQLISQKNYTSARSQWLTARANLWKQFPTDRPLATPEIRAMWLDRGTIVRAGSERGLAEVFDRIAKAGINTVFFETVNAGYPIYPSSIAPQQNPLIRGWDPLAAAVKLAHARGIELHAWVWTFAAGNRRHNALVSQPENYPGPLITAHPDWASYDNRGELYPIGQTKPFLDPANLQVRQYLFNLYDEIISRYDVDGLQLDYIRYPFQDPAEGRTYGYGRASRAQFTQLYRIDPTQISPQQADLWSKWTAFRTQQVDSFVAEVSQQLRQKRPNLILSVAVFPLREQERIQKIQQHWELWAQRGDVDLIVPMTYAMDTHSFGQLAQPWSTSNQLGASLIIPGIRLLNLPSIGAFDQIQLVRDLPVSGYALFASENFSSELQQVFNSTQGRETHTKEPIPYRQPFMTALLRYSALQREWNFLLQNNKLQLKEPTLSVFKRRSEGLESALKQLASAPNTSNFAAATASLNTFQSQFRDWMYPQSLENPYQVRAWTNRLATLERLLRYGEQAQLQRRVPIAEK